MFASVIATSATALQCSLLPMIRMSGFGVVPHWLHFFLTDQGCRCLYDLQTHLLSWCYIQTSLMQHQPIVTNIRVPLAKRELARMQVRMNLPQPDVAAYHSRTSYPRRSPCSPGVLHTQYQTHAMHEKLSWPLRP